MLPRNSRWPGAGRVNVAAPSYYSPTAFLERAAHGLVAQLFRIFNGLAITGKQDGFVPASEIKWLTFVSDEMLKARAACARPNFNCSYHKWLGKVFKDVHNKKPQLITS
jgi:hypothetical protein